VEEKRRWWDEGRGEKKEKNQIELVLWPLVNSSPSGSFES
jgi:hypothetical protein